MLENENGYILTSQAEIEVEVLEFYGNLMDKRENELSCIDIRAMRKGDQLQRL